MTVNLDKVFIDELNEEFSTPNVKQALYRLLEFYKKNTILDIKAIEKDDVDYKFVMEARKRRENGEKIYSINDVLNELE